MADSLPDVLGGEHPGGLEPRAITEIISVAGHEH